MTELHQVNAAFLIPFRTDHGPRQQLLDWVVARIEAFFPNSCVYIGSGSERGEFNRSAAINEAFVQSDEDYVVVNDSDTIWNPSTILSALHHLQHHGGWTIPYKRYRRMDQTSTEDLLRDSVTTVLTRARFSYENEIEENVDVYHAPPVSGLLMMGREQFSELGGFDERFVGWGEEDVAFVIKAKGKFGKPIRLDESVYHMWHPKGLEYDQPHFKANQRLLRKVYQ